MMPSAARSTSGTERQEREAIAKALSQERFGRFAASYVTSKTHAKGAELDRLLELAQPKAHWTMLDVATGGGHTALRFAPAVARVVASDVTLRMVKQAKDYICGKAVDNVTFQLADAHNLPFAGRSFHLVTCRIAPHHFSDPQRFVQEGARALKPGGLLLVQDLALPEEEQAARYVDAFERLRDPSHRRGYAVQEWVEMFERAGLRVQHTELVAKRHELKPWAERQACTPETIGLLTEMVTQAGRPVLEWMQPGEWGTDGAWFVNQHLLIAGRAPEGRVERNDQ